LQKYDERKALYFLEMVFYLTF